MVDQSSPDIARLADEFTKWVEQYALKVCPEGCLPTVGQEREINLFARIVIALRSAQPVRSSAGNELPWWKILADNWRGRNGNSTTGDSVRNSCADELEKCAARALDVAQPKQEQK